MQRKSSIVIDFDKSLGATMLNVSDGIETLFLKSVGQLILIIVLLSLFY